MLGAQQAASMRRPTCVCSTHSPSSAVPDSAATVSSLLTALNTIQHIAEVFLRFRL
jgi:hypothetical protein